MHLKSNFSLFISLQTNYFVYISILHIGIVNLTNKFISYVERYYNLVI